MLIVILSHKHSFRYSSSSLLPSRQYHNFYHTQYFFIHILDPLFVCTENIRRNLHFCVSVVLKKYMSITQYMLHFLSSILPCPIYPSTISVRTENPTYSIVNRVLL